MQIQFINPSRLRDGLTFIVAIIIISTTNLVAQIQIGPYLQNPTQTSITICWIAEETGFGEVKFGTDTTLSKSRFSGQKTTYHRIALDSLNPQTEYYYQVSGNGYSSDVYKFRTAPADTSFFTFVVLGDTRTGDEVHKQIVEKIININPDFVINTGDLVPNGTRLKDWDIFFDINKDMMKTIPYFPVLGNHEENSDHYFNYFLLPGNERYYSFSWGNSFFIALDSNNPYIKSEEQKTFLNAQLEEGKEKNFTFVVYHHPPYSSVNTRREDREKNRHHFLDIFQKRKPDIVFNGHDHNYQRFLVNEINYVVAGGGGAPLYKIGIPDEGFITGAEEYSYCIITVSGPNLKMEVFGLGGKLLDKMEITSKR
ncbi:MAG: metallophosphoesterase family protein [Bacteroidota bacterium]